MSISAGDVISLSQSRANLSELVDQVKARAEKIITKNGESYVAVIDGQPLSDDLSSDDMEARTAPIYEYVETLMRSSAVN